MPEYRDSVRMAEKVHIVLRDSEGNLKDEREIGYKSSRIWEAIKCFKRKIKGLIAG
jgi:hypothetical protein